MKKVELQKLIKEELLKEDATGAFRQNVTKAKTLLSAIEKQIAKMEKEQKAEPKSWEWYYGGAMSKVVDELTNTFKFISRQE